MKKLIFLSILFLFGTAGVVSAATSVIDDPNLSPQNCDRTNPACAFFLETTSQGQIKWGGLVAGGLRSLTNLFVDGKLGVGTLRPSTGEQILKLDVEGAIGAKYYCDENGNNCVAGGDLGGGGGDGGNITINEGDGIKVNRSGDIYNISIDPTKTQKRVWDSCAAGEAIQLIHEDGSVECEKAGSTGTGSNFWEKITVSGDSNVIRPISPIDRVQISGNGGSGDGSAIGDGSNNYQPVFKVFDPEQKSYAYLSATGNGGIFAAGNNGAAGVAGITTGGFIGNPSPSNGSSVSTAVLGLTTGKPGSYAARFIGGTSVFTRGYLGLFATDDKGIPGESFIQEGTEGVPYFSPVNSYAAYFKGRTAVNGKLGVGTNDPIGPLYVNGKGFTPIYLSTDSGLNGPASYRIQTDSGIAGQGKAFGIYSNDVETWRLFINGDGNVGINTTDPKAKLDILGSIKITDGSQGEGKVLTSDANGKARWETFSGTGTSGSGLPSRSDFTTIEKSGSGATSLVASCPAGSVAISGGAKFNSNDETPDLVTRPGTVADYQDLSSWTCTQSDPDSGNFACYVRCQKTK